MRARQSRGERRRESISRKERERARGQGTKPGFPRILRFVSLARESRGCRRRRRRSSSRRRRAARAATPVTGAVDRQDKRQYSAWHQPPAAAPGARRDLSRDMPGILSIPLPVPLSGVQHHAMPGHLNRAALAPNPLLSPSAPWPLPLQQPSSSLLPPLLPPSAHRPLLFPASTLPHQNK